jgi:peptide/nickel transport system substrate-binding protein
MAYALLEILEILRRAATFPGATNMTNSFNRSDIDRRRFLQTGGAASLATGFCGIDPVLAQSRAETLLVVQELGPNSLDMQGVGSNQTVNGLSWNCYDRLLSYASKTLPDGTLSYDRAVLAPELAEKWEVAADGMSCTFYLRKDATFHDGTPVTAKDVKWSFDRAVKVGGFPTFQMSAGSLEKPEQFVVVDDHTFRIDYIRKDKMLLFNVAVVVPFVINSELAKKNATENDPWAMQWLKVNEAGGGAYRIESWKAGSETIFTRFDNWKSGPLPAIKRVIARDVPSPGTRRAMLERGDADFSTGFPPRDFEQLIKEGKLKVSGVPIPNALWYIALNTSRPPFDNPKLRQAIAFAMPYEQIQANAFFGRAVPMYGGPAAVEKAVWPQAFPYVTDLDKAKALMKEAGVEGLETTLSLDVGTATVGEPTALLIQENLAKIGIKAAVEKIPGANWRTTLNKKELPMVLNRFSGWLDYPEYYFFWNFHGNNSIFNISAYRSKEMDALIDKARFATDPAEYDAAVKAFITLCIKDVPVVPLNQPIHDVALQKNVSGYEFWFHREPDYRRFTKA